MSLGFLQIAMLGGLAAMALPVLAHLISRRRFDIVQWGAMQFLQLGRKTRRRIRLEELLLMLLRMGILGAIAFAMARPWASGGAIGKLTGRVSRDVVLVIDGSYSMGWKGPVETPHAKAIQWAHQCLDTLRPGDTVSILDVRDQVRPVIETPSGDFDYARNQLDDLPDPAGSSNLASGLRQAVQILSRSNNVSREVILLTDQQRVPWKLEDAYQWTRIDDTTKQMTVPPRLWVVDLVGEVQDRVNVAVGRLELSRELTVPQFPIRVRATLSQTNSETKRVTAHFEVDGQRIAAQSQAIDLPANGETTVEFEHRFPETGSHLVAVVIDEDRLPGDDRSEAVVDVADGIPVLVVDGDPNADPTLSDGFFVTSAFTGDRRAPWVRAESIPITDFTSQSLSGKAVAWLLNVPTLNQTQGEGIAKFVRDGGTVVFAAGPKSVAGWFPSLPEALTGPLMPAKLIEIQSETDLKLGSMRLGSDSLKAPWLERFQKDQGVDLTASRFAKWWKLEPVAAPADDPAKKPAANGDASEASQGGSVLAKFENGLPWMVSRRVGKGNVVQLATPLDSDWSTLPSKNDFVPLLHELVFALSTQRTTRNVDIGSPLVLDDAPLGELIVKDPDGKESRIPTKVEGDRRLAQFTRTGLPGVYEMRSAAGAGPIERFVVNFDRKESQLTPLSPPEVEGLTKKGLKVTEDPEAVARDATDNQSRSEFWWWLLLVVFGMLVFEVVMTRRLVQGGHVLVEPETM
jgi:hypothetical protein